MDNIVKIEAAGSVILQRKRVAAYARVSSGKDAMLHSLAAQVSYYSSMIQSHSDWQYCGVYSDEAMTGTKKERPGFQSLLADCRAGKIDLIITKTISRFSRNTLVFLETVRELRSLGVDVFFEDQNIHSSSESGELLITLLASLAQEESLSASENQKWKIRKNFSEGIPTTNLMYGYRTENGVMTVIPEEAEVVRMIFNDYLSGMGANAIVRKLTDLGVPTKLGGRWRENIIRDMLKNEKYKGDLLLQKTFRPDHVSKKTVFNKGQLPQFYVQDDHDAIVPPDVFNAVQAEIARRTESVRKEQVQLYPFSGKIICEKCGKHFRRKTTKSGIKWVCSTYNTYGKAACDAQQIPEQALLAIVGDRPFACIRVPEDGTVIVCGEDGSESIHHWENPSRAESWTPEMRQRAAERSRRQWQQNR